LQLIFCNASALTLDHMDTVIFHLPEQLQIWKSSFLLLLSSV